MGGHRRGQRRRSEQRTVREVAALVAGPGSQYGSRWNAEPYRFCDCDDEECVGGAVYCENRVYAHEELGRVLGRPDRQRGAS